MKYPNKWKTSVKLGMASALAYTMLNFVTPVLATNNQTQIQSHDNVTTVEQLEKIYNDQRKKYAKDGMINHKEIISLNKILKKKQDLLIKQKCTLLDKIYQEPSGKFVSEIREVKNSLDELEEKKVYVRDSFEKIKENFNEKILYYYPSLLNGEIRMIYASSEPIEKDVNSVMKVLVKEANDILKKYYKDTRLEVLNKKETYCIRDVFIFYKAISAERADICLNCEEMEQKKQKQKEVLKELESKKNKKIKERNERLNYTLVDVRTEIKRVEQTQTFFTQYQRAKGKVDSFIEEYDDLNKYMGLSYQSNNETAIKPGFLHGISIEGNRKEFNSRNKEAIEGLEGYFKNQDFEIKIESLKNPAQLMFSPWPWWINTIFGGVFPWFRNYLSAKVVRRRYDAFDAASPVLEGMLGTLFLDGAFPLMYPLRVFGMPFLIEPIRRLTRLQKVK